MGYAQEIKTDEEPFYLSTHTFAAGETDVAKARHSWDLSYPVKFFERLCRVCLGNLDRYLRDTKIDPYSSYQFGTYWIEDLNA